MYHLTHKSKKIIMTIMIFTLITSLFAVFPSAQADTRAVPDIVIEAGTYRFTNRISRLTFQVPTDEYPTFISNGVEYYQMSFIGDETDFIISYSNGDIQNDVYDSRYGWLDTSYQVITFVEDYTEETQDFARWFDNYAKPYAPAKGMYYDILDILTEAIYDKDFDALDSFERITSVLLSTVSSVAVVALPLIVIFWLTKYLFSLFKYF